MVITIGRSIAEGALQLGLSLGFGRALDGTAMLDPISPRTLVVATLLVAKGAGELLSSGASDTTKAVKHEGLILIGLVKAKGVVELLSLKAKRTGRRLDGDIDGRGDVALGKLAGLADIDNNDVFGLLSNKLLDLGELEDLGGLISRDGRVAARRAKNPSGGALNGRKARAGSHS